MKRLLKWVGTLVLLAVLSLVAPIGYIEVACRPTGIEASFKSDLPTEQHRAEGRTLLTYPEWHIVHAYDDYAKVIATGDPHDYRYLSSIGGFWTSLCSLSKASGSHGGFPSEFKSTIYTIGVSFSAELVAKALYEESIGRVATWIRGNTRAPLDDLTAQQATQYAEFLRQIPWYRWDFGADAADLKANATSQFRDRERRIAVGLEYKAKAQYAKVIAAAVANMEPDALRLQMILTGLEPKDFETHQDVQVIAQTDDGLIIETPRYRELTILLLEWANAGADFVEIAGNDDILFSATSQTENLDRALYSFSRQGYGDTRHLILLPVASLAQTLRDLDKRDLSLEHIHDY